MEYEIFESETAEGLKTQVVLAMKEGWRPQGGVVVVQRLSNKTKFVNENHSTLYSTNLGYAQAMIRETDHANK